MAKSGSSYEATVFVDTFPSGKSWARDIDDFMRQILDALLMRLGQDHLWRNVGDTTEEPNYSSEVEGMHRPSAARAWIMDLDTNGYPVFSWGVFSSLSDEVQGALNNALLAFKTEGEATATQMVGRWEGSTWVIHGTRLRPLIHKLRGAVDFMGLMRFGPVNTSYHNQMLSGILIDENLGGLRPQLEVPTPLSDAHYYECYYLVSVKEHTEGNAGEILARQRKIYPVRVGRFDKYGKNRAPDNENISYGLMWEVSNTDEQGTATRTESLKMYLTARGLEFVTDPVDQSIFINGIDIFNHDHSGTDGMGKPFDWTRTEDPTTALTYSTYLIMDSARNTEVFSGTNAQEIFADEFSETGEFAPSKMYPVDADNVPVDLNGKTRMYQFDLDIAAQTGEFNLGFFHEYTFMVAAEIESYQVPHLSGAPNVIGAWSFSPNFLSGGRSKRHTFTAIVPGAHSELAPSSARLHAYLFCSDPDGSTLILRCSLAVSVITWRI